MLREARTAPVLGEMVSEPLEAVTELTAPAALLMQVPAESIKQPLASWIPLAKVEVTELEVMLRAVASIPAPKVEVVLPEIVVVAVSPT